MNRNRKGEIKMQNNYRSFRMLKDIETSKLLIKHVSRVSEQSTQLFQQNGETVKLIDRLKDQLKAELQVKKETMEGMGIDMDKEKNKLLKEFSKLYLAYSVIDCGPLGEIGIQWYCMRSIQIPSDLLKHLVYDYDPSSGIDYSLELELYLTKSEVAKLNNYCHKAFNIRVEFDGYNDKAEIWLPIVERENREEFMLPKKHKGYNLDLDVSGWLDYGCFVGSPSMVGE
jgi:hypothetical protein